jgi:2-polyprenyl-3-methyl-5-hydroxy-6-metoxy-1,4-benzoquinol methylase
LGGYKVSLRALKQLMTAGKKMMLVDIGCGGGDTLKEINKWAVRNNYDLKLIGIDLKSDCITYCRQNTKDLDIDFICDDYRNVLQHVKNPDILHASLFCHHLNEQQLTDLVTFSLQNKIRLVINDLERNPLAFYSIKFLTGVFSKSYLVENDAPLSVARGFKKAEWKKVLTKAGAKNFTVHNRWAFRHEIIVYG